MATMAKRLKAKPGSRRAKDRKDGSWFVLVRMPVSDFDLMKAAAQADRRPVANWIWHVAMRALGRG